MNIMPRKIIGENLKNEIRSFYQIKPITIREVGKEFNLSDPTIIKILGDTPRWPKNKILNPEINEDYFEVIDNERKAYFIGLMIISLKTSLKADIDSLGIVLYSSKCVL